MVVASVAAGLRLLHRVTRSREEILYRTRIVDGDRFELVTKAPAQR
jgi:hypothetical protein